MKTTSPTPLLVKKASCKAYNATPVTPLLKTGQGTLSPLLNFFQGKTLEAGEGSL